MQKTFSSLGVRNFRLFFIGQLVSNTGNWLTNVALILFVIKLTHNSGLAVGILAACSFGPVLLLTAWAGAIVDSSNKRHFLLLTQSLEMLQSFGLAALAFTNDPPLYGIYILAIFGGIFLAFDNPVRRSFVNEMVPKSEIPNAVTLYGIIVNGSRFVGPTLAGALVLSVGYGWTFIVDAMSYLIVIACILLMRPDELFLQPIAARTKGAVRSGLHYIRATPELWISFIILGFVGIFAYNFIVTLPLFITKGLHAGSSTFTVLYSVFSLGSIAGALLIAKRRLTELHHLVWGTIALGISMILLAIVPNVFLAMLAGFLVGAASLVYITAATTLMQIKSEPKMLARVLALQTVFLFGTTPIGGPLLGGLADLTDGRVPILLGGAVALGSGFLGMYLGKRYNV